MQYLLPTKKQKKYTLSIIWGLIANVILNWLLIPPFKAQGASIATTIAQFIVVIVQLYYVRKDLNVKELLKSGKNYLISSCVMLGICMIIGLTVPNDLLSIGLKVVLGAGTYFLMLIVLGDKYIYEARDMVISKIRKK